MPKRPDDYMAVRRDEILDAVELCCREKGWTKTTLRDVATAAGISKGGLYVHFASKEDLLRALLLRNLESIERMGDFPDVDAFIAWTQRNIDYVTRPGGRESAISQNELQLDSLRNPELQPVVEKVARQGLLVLEAVIRKFCPGLSAEQLGDRALALFFFLEGLRNHVAFTPNAAADQLQRLAAQQLRKLLSDED